MKRPEFPIGLTMILAVGVFWSPVRAALVITEVMSNSLHPAGAANGDWWELTNTGGSDINLLDYSVEVLKTQSDGTGYRQATLVEPFRHFDAIGLTLAVGTAKVQWLPQRARLHTILAQFLQQHSTAQAVDLVLHQNRV